MDDKFGVPPAGGETRRGPAREARAAIGRGGFTLMELMISVAILIIIILSVGITFNGASKSVGLSQATMEVMNSTRGVQQLLERDLAGIDKNGFLVIKCRMFDPSLGDRSLRFDQVSFLSYGSFPHRGGVDVSANVPGFTSPLLDSTTGNAARIWWGHLIMDKVGGNGANSFVAPSESSPNPTINNLPTGAISTSDATHPIGVTKESDFILGRTATLLIPGQPNANNDIFVNGAPILAYLSLDGKKNGGPPQVIGNDNGSGAQIISSRHDVVAQSPTQVMQSIAMSRAQNADYFTVPPGPAQIPEADLLTYRFHALSTVYDIDTSIANSTSTINPLVAAYFRMTPVVMPSVSSFKVEWSDGTTWPQGTVDPITGQNLTGQLIWFGPNRMHKDPNNPLLPDPVMERYFPNGWPSGDTYQAVFSYFNKPSWPRALRFTMHVASERLSGGRDFVQVIDLPQ